MKPRFVICLALALAISVTAACKRREGITVQQTDEDSATIASVIQVSDPRAKQQLLAGFHDIEDNAWRWTARVFSVALRPPANAGQKGATLTLKGAVPDAVIQKLNALSLSATVGGVSLPPETFSAPGEFTYTREVPAKAFSGEAVNVEFSLDKALPPSESDTRELGVIVTSVGLEVK